MKKRRVSVFFLWMICFQLECSETILSERNDNTVRCVICFEDIINEPIDSCVSGTKIIDDFYFVCGHYPHLHQNCIKAWASCQIKNNAPQLRYPSCPLCKTHFHKLFQPVVTTVSLPFNDNKTKKNEAWLDCFVPHAILNDKNIVFIAGKKRIRKNFFLPYYQWFPVLLAYKNEQLDTSFAKRGMAIIPVKTTETLSEDVFHKNLVMKMTEMKLFIGGAKKMSATLPATCGFIAVYKKNGGIDYLFGNRGMITLPDISEVTALLVSKIGNLFAAGVSHKPSDFHCSVYSFNESGEPEQSFGCNGETCFFAGPSTTITALQFHQNNSALLAVGTGFFSAEGSLIKEDTFNTQRLSDYKYGMYTMSFMRNGCFNKQFRNNGIAMISCTQLGKSINQWVHDCIIDNEENCIVAATVSSKKNLIHCDQMVCYVFDKRGNCKHSDIMEFPRVHEENKKASYENNYNGVALKDKEGRVLFFGNQKRWNKVGSIVGVGFRDYTIDKEIYENGHYENGYTGFCKRGKVIINNNFGFGSLILKDACINENDDVIMTGIRKDSAEKKEKCFVALLTRSGEIKLFK